ncbi:cyclic peptide export ABC transporter [Gynuella sunshinyii]|uniref:ABC-type siderophore export system, fused ATPase and permease component n=1 Tax=Gynuella sunshinyii YC6258 TaxID=1445510 RepID=A0A0C5V7T3_9GAMM|nr:cyclic peptide export ABC transporter [Gynuella sunshinyii]AJQ95480.1 ABC-type siderophore export system, fused ATPase and permease component [Gynuella sunshinyii YC6258]
MNMMKQLLAQSKGTMMLAVLASLCSAAAGITLVGGINHALENGIHSLAGSGGFYLALVALLFASGVWSQILLVGLGHKMVYRLRCRLVERILNTPLARQEALGAPALYNALTRDVTMVANATRQLPVSLYNGLLLVTGLAYLAWLSPLLFGGLVILVGLGVWGDFRLAGRIKTMMQKVRRLDDELFRQYEAVVEGRNELGLSEPRRRFQFHQRFKPQAQQARDTAIKAEVLWAINLNWTTVLVFALIGMIFFAGLAVETVSQEVIVGYVLAIMFLRTPIAMILDAIPAVIRGNVALRAIDRLQLGEAESGISAPSENAAIQAPAFESLQLKQALYRYLDQGDEAGFQLGPVDLDIRSGELIFLIGGNGSGKSTLAKLLTGLYLPTDGSVSLNGEPLTEQTAAQHRSCFAAIFPNFFLFDDVLDATGVGADHPRIQHYLKRLAIDHKVTVEDGKLSTKALSQGQRKRLALLLMYLEDRQVLLLDEWAADQDPVFREVFYREILPELKAAGKTVIAITHDDRYFDAADRLYKLEQGKIFEFVIGRDQVFGVTEKLKNSGAV